MPQDRVLAFYCKRGVWPGRGSMIYLRARSPRRIRVGGPWSVAALTGEWYYLRPVARLPQRKRHAYTTV